MIHKGSTGDTSDLEWFKSSYSSGTNGESCVELALTPGTVYVRDSKTTGGPRIAFTSDTWAAFVPYASGE
ncbi:hypothetical protein SUDANB60_02799 [Streptomyces sp. enrichment culture]|uniref:DUF397 domain-containing protein n=1 Tax=Streptomyces sp. enrichment culture TaxID=1795815 RepID=UPI003F54797D|nr:DUF397 domain-containing protein [Streptomyces werraensis]